MLGCVWGALVKCLNVRYRGYQRWGEGERGKDVHVGFGCDWGWEMGERRNQGNEVMNEMDDGVVQGKRYSKLSVCMMYICLGGRCTTCTVCACVPVRWRMLLVDHPRNCNKSHTTLLRFLLNTTIPLFCHLSTSFAPIGLINCHARFSRCNSMTESTDALSRSLRIEPVVRVSAEVER